jgi:hypothetical protein
MQLRHTEYPYFNHIYQEKLSTRPSTGTGKSGNGKIRTVLTCCKLRLCKISSKKMIFLEKILIRPQIVKPSSFFGFHNFSNIKNTNFLNTVLYTEEDRDTTAAL